MQATYPFPEVKFLIRSLDISSISILEELLDEEKDAYSYYEWRALCRFRDLKNKILIQNEVKAEFLLSFN